MLLHKLKNHYSYTFMTQILCIFIDSFEVNKKVASSKYYAYTPEHIEMV